MEEYDEIMGNYPMTLKITDNQDGLTRSEIKKLTNLTDGLEIFPIIVTGDDCFALGFLDNDVFSDVCGSSQIYVRFNDYLAEELNDGIFDHEGEYVIDDDELPEELHFVFYVKM